MLLVGSMALRVSRPFNIKISEILDSTSVHSLSLKDSTTQKTTRERELAQ